MGRGTSQALTAARGGILQPSSIWSAIMRISPSSPLSCSQAARFFAWEAPTSPFRGAARGCSSAASANAAAQRRMLPWAPVLLLHGARGAHLQGDDDVAECGNEGVASAVGEGHSVVCVGPAGVGAKMCDCGHQHSSCQGRCAPAPRHGSGGRPGGPSPQLLGLHAAQMPRPHWLCKAGAAQHGRARARVPTCMPRRRCPPTKRHEGVP